MPRGGNLCLGIDLTKSQFCDATLTRRLRAQGCYHPMLWVDLFIIVAVRLGRARTKSNWLKWGGALISFLLPRERCIVNL